MVIGAGLIVSGHWILSLLPMFKTDPGNSLHSQLMAGGGGLFTLALTVAPLKQITPNRKRIAIFIAAKSMPAESIERIISESLREALKP